MRLISAPVDSGAGREVWARAPGDSLFNLRLLTLTDDGRDAVLLRGPRTGAWSIWRLSIANGDARMIAPPHREHANLMVSPDGRRAAVVRNTFSATELWVLEHPALRPAR